MSVVFADAFYFVARLNRRDQHHDRVVAFARNFRARLVTTDWVLMEVADAGSSFRAGRLHRVAQMNDAGRGATTKLAARRNEPVAALADEVWFAHITPGGQMERLATKAAVRGTP